MSEAELVTPDGTSQLGVHDGYFAAVLSGVASSSGGLPTSGAYSVVGLDTHGAVARTVDLDEFVAATP